VLKWGNGAARGIRTPDPIITNDAAAGLDFRPGCKVIALAKRVRREALDLLEARRIAAE
jgi:hypothetical protein